jgi:hypothetical protein
MNWFPPQVLQCVTLLISPVHILLYMCPHTPIYFSSCRDYSEMVLEFILLHTTIVLILYICALIPRLLKDGAGFLKPQGYTGW